MDKPLNNLDQLFSIAKTESPAISFEQTQTLFVASVAAQLGATSLWLKIRHILKNPLIMLGTSGIIITAAALLLTVNTNEGISQDKVNNPEPAQEILTSVESSPIKTLELLEVAKSKTVSQEDFLPKITEVESIEDEGTEILTNSFTEISNSLTLKHSAIDYNYSEEQVSEEFIFQISHETSREEFESIREKALKAGMSFEYKMNVRKNRLKRLKMEISHDNSSSKNSLMFNGEFDLEIGWVQDENGRAVEFYSSDEEKFFGALGDASDELEDLFDEREDELFSLYEEDSELLDQFLITLSDQREGLFEQLGNIQTLDLESGISEIDEILREAGTMPVSLFEEREVSAGGDYERIAHIITNRTTEEELNEIQAAAVKAGINVSRTSKFKKEMLRELNLFLTLTDKEGEKMVSSFYIHSGKNESYNLTVVWRVDKEGNAVDFNGNKCQRICN